MKPMLIKVKQTDSDYPEDLRYDDIFTSTRGLAVTMLVRAQALVG